MVSWLKKCFSSVRQLFRYNSKGQKGFQNLMGGGAVGTLVPPFVCHNRAGGDGKDGIVLLIMLKNFNKNCRNISIFTSISYHTVFTQPPFLICQHNRQYDTLLPIPPCTHKLKAGIAY